MTIAEFFAKINIQVKGEEGLNKIYESVSKLAIGVGSVVMELNNMKDALEGLTQINTVTQKVASVSTDKVVSDIERLKQQLGTEKEEKINKSAEKLAKEQGYNNTLLISLKKMTGEYRQMNSDVRTLTFSQFLFTKAAEATGSVLSAMKSSLDNAMGRGVELSNIKAGFGLDDKEIQNWQRAAKLAGQSKEDVMGFAKFFQQEQTNLRTGKGINEIWGKLGLTESLVNGKPSKMLEEITAKMADMDDESKGLARSLLNQAGITDGMFITMIRHADMLKKYGKLDFRNITDREKKDLEGYGLAVYNLGDAWGNFKDKLYSTLGKVLSPIVEKLAEFVDWLTKGLNAMPQWARNVIGWTLAITGATFALISFVAGLKAVMYTMKALKMLETFTGLGSIIAKAFNVSIITSFAGALGTVATTLGVIASYVAPVLALFLIMKKLGGAQDEAIKKGESTFLDNWLATFQKGYGKVLNSLTPNSNITPNVNTGKNQSGNVITNHFTVTSTDPERNTEEIRKMLTRTYDGIPSGSIA